MHKPAGKADLDMEISWNLLFLTIIFIRYLWFFWAEAWRSAPAILTASIPGIQLKFDSGRQEMDKEQHQFSVIWNDTFRFISIYGLHMNAVNNALELSGENETEKSSRRRQCILRAVNDALAECDYSKLTVEDIAARAGVGKSTIYRWWKHKSDLVFETFKRKYRVCFWFGF